MRLLMIALAALLFLAACGKKAPLRPPESPPHSDAGVSGEWGIVDSDQ